MDGQTLNLEGNPMTYEFLPPANFLGLPPEHSSLDASKVIVLPVPYELTTSYGQGTRNGPRALLHASQQVELYDREFDAECALAWGVHTLPALAPNYASPEAAHGEIAAAVADYAARDALLCVLGGEHSISGSVADGLHRVHGPFVTVQLDAHADLRDSYEGTPYSHASAMRRVIDRGGGPVFQLGIRSLSVDEAEYIRDRPGEVQTFFAEQVHAGAHRAALREFVAGKQVFLTIDVDCFDAALMPATGTPEPDGLLWPEVLEIVRIVAAASARVLAFDIMELAPIPGIQAPDYLAAKLTYKVMSIIMEQGSQITNLPSR
jgi:agmatinase